MQDYSNIILFIRSHSSLFQIQIQKYRHKYNTIFLSSSSTDRVHCYFKYKYKQLKMQHYSIHFPCPLWISQSSWLDYKDMSFMWLPHLRSATINSRTSLTYCNDGQMNLFMTTEVARHIRPDIWFLIPPTRKDLRSASSTMRKIMQCIYALQNNTYWKLHNQAFLKKSFSLHLAWWPANFM